MPYLMRGALVEYGNDLIGPLKNVVVFQFNPETLSRSIRVPVPPEQATGKEKRQVGDPPTESIQLTAHFSAADDLSRKDETAMAFGVGPRLAALEKMARTVHIAETSPEKPLDPVDSAVSKDKDQDAVQPVTRERYPNILFIWGATRVLPVTIDSLTITEQLYDNRLNPIQAEVSLTLTAFNRETGDKVADGAMRYTGMMGDRLTKANLPGGTGREIDLIPF